MKKTALLLAFSISSIVIFAQNNNSHRMPPQSVQRSWHKDYPNDNDNQSWDFKNNQWHKRYMDKDHNNRSVDVYYDRNGRRLMSQTQWDRNDLPQNVRDRIKSRYRTDSYDAIRVEKPGRGFYFQISLGNNRKVYLDNRGREVKYH